MTLSSRRFLGAIILLSFSVIGNGQPKSTQNPSGDYSKETVAQLIDDLTQINSFAPGLDSAGMYDGFIAGDRLLTFGGGVLGVPPPTVPPQMRELVRRGPLALAELVKHIDDGRLTKLHIGNTAADDAHVQVGVNEFSFSFFSEEYDPRTRDDSDPSSRKDMLKWLEGEKDLNGSYTVKVGDVCFVLIGQIVNRRLLAARYQPSGGLVVNSPVELPALAEKVRHDWAGADAETLKSSLLADIHGKNRPGRADKEEELEMRIYPALERLRLYFPDAYQSLSGSDLKKKEAFEAGKF